MVLQTRNTASEAIVFGARGDYLGMVAHLETHRRSLGYPPFGRLCRVVFEDKDAERGRATADRWAAELKGHLAREGRVFRFFRPVNRDLGLTDAAMAWLYDAGLGERATIRAADLSHGERRQLEFAIALAMRPKVFLMDEPMAGLSPDGSRRMTAFLDKLRATAPILLVEHDMEAVFALADRISVLVYGQVIATGTVAEIRANPEVRTAYLGDEAA